MRTFEFGKITVTSAVYERMQRDAVFAVFVNDSLEKFISCEWGDLCEDDKQVNEDALKHGDRLFGSYIMNEDTKIFIITEADRSVTTVLFPSDY